MRKWQGLHQMIVTTCAFCSLSHCWRKYTLLSNIDVIMMAMASQITGVLIVYSTVCSGAHQRNIKLRVTGLCEGNSTLAGGFPSQRASNAEKVSIWWRHHGVAKSLAAMVLGMQKNNSLSSPRKDFKYHLHRYRPRQQRPSDRHPWDINRSLIDVNPRVFAICECHGGLQWPVPLQWRKW